MQDEELAGSPAVAGLMAGDEQPELAGKPVAALAGPMAGDEQLAEKLAAGSMAGDEQLTGKPAAGLMEQPEVEDEQFAGYLAAGLAQAS
jgi:hypothetical protein